ncbi:hypothetical protein PENTCL1PPCAC_15050, partial [Pristionchus entomophagus]
EKKWVIYNGFCIRPNLHAGRNVTLRSLSDSGNRETVVLEGIPKDEAEAFNDDLTLLTHTSASALDENYLSKLLINWRGPISLAVLLQGEQGEGCVREKIEWTLQFLPDQYTAQLAVHIIFERVPKLSCDRSSRIRRDDILADTVFFASYPINTVRNVARLFSATRYIVFADSDYLFSSGFYYKILPILRENIPVGSKNALLYRIFEIDEE